MKQQLAVNLPDFRNWGVIFRVLLWVQVLRFLVLLMSSVPAADWQAWPNSQSILFEPTLLAVIALLAAFSPVLRRQTYGMGCVLVLCISAATAVLLRWLLILWLPVVVVGPAWQAGLAGVCLAGALLFYFNWRHHRLSPAWSDARLMALQARIQPHFLFNSLNSVLSLIRVDPPKAETMLEDLCDLFRSLLGDGRQLVPLSQELELARTYVQIETIRFGPRLQVRWACADAPGQALVPPLLLQPLLENAVRYGVEPQAQGALITVEVSGKGQQLDIRVSNPVPAQRAASLAPSHNGNHMALDNLRERLALHYDAEATLTTQRTDGAFEVRVRLPVRMT